MRRIRAFSLGACIVVTPVLTGCNALVLDNTIPGTDEERGLRAWVRMPDPSR